jgi:transcriptional regulator with XRE-family HTH domain
MRGYSQHIVEGNQQADPSNIGVYLGQVCIPLKIPAANVAKELGISRQSVYSYFLGKIKPTIEKEARIKELIEKLKS